MPKCSYKTACSGNDTLLIEMRVMNKTELLADWVDALIEEIYFQCALTNPNCEGCKIHELVIIEHPG